MKTKIIFTLLIFSMVLVIPQVNAQTESYPNVDHKSVEVNIDIDGKVSVIHQIRDSNDPRQLKLLDGTISNLQLVDDVGKRENVDISEDEKSIILFPEQEIVFVIYDLGDVLFQKNNIWTLNFLYLESTTFTVPKEVDQLFVNERPVFFKDENSFTCHGCQMILEYTIDEPRKIERVNWENREFDVEMITFAEIENFEFNQPSKEISFNVNESEQFVTTVIPLELLWGPYAVFLDDEKMYFHEYVNNGTHVWVNIKPDTTGQVSIIGTTVVPEFSVIAPLAIGFLMIMVMPFIKKFNLH